MNNKAYTSAVENQQYPDSISVPLGTTFENEVGIIQNLLFTPINSVAVITSKAGTERSNHYHKTDYHYLYVMSGKVEYFQRDLDGGDIRIKIFGPGQMFFTPPMKVHLVKFLEDTVLLSFAKNVRDHEHHEEDVVREKF